jgi:hypothetical protein
MITDRQKRQAGFAAIVLWFIAAYLLDRYFFLAHIPELSNSLYLQNLELGAEPFKRAFPRFGLFVFLVIPSFLGALVLLPFLRVRRHLPWRESLIVSGAAMFWFFLIPVFIWVGHILYKIADELLGDWKPLKAVFAFCETFTFKGSLYMLGGHLFDIDASLAALLGAGLGILLFYRKGLWNGFSRSNKPEPWSLTTP